MAYVNFYKGLAANYVAETHKDGIYQCTDTGDTYIFGVLNSGTEGGSSQSIIILDWAEDLAGGKGTISDNAYNLLNNFITSQDINTPVFIKAVRATSVQAVPEGGGLTINLIPAEIYISGPMLYLSLFTKLDISNEAFPTDILLSDIGVISKVNFLISMDSKSIELTTVGNLEFELKGDGTKFLSDDGSYKTPTMDLATPSSNGLMSSTDKAKLDRMESTATRSNLSSVPLAANQIIVATLSGNATLSLTGTLSEGQDTHIFVRNTSSSAITITMPSSSTYVNAQDSIEIPGSGYGEINIMRAGNYYFVRGAASE